MPGLNACLFTNMKTLIAKVLQWGIDKGITGPNGKGTRLAQALKMLEESEETATAVRDFEILKTPELFEEVIDGIGDTCVTLILLAELHNLTLEECLEHAYEIINKRKGEMVNGTFVKE